MRGEHVMFTQSALVPLWRELQPAAFGDNYLEGFSSSRFFLTQCKGAFGPGALWTL